ncbi:hypothetical protein COLO4_36238 [Corchorus olitorius]|uniref:Uncharacterized protein n=1 Tax=Corchorus olitorius TaxID=93759 RepID=A0A1R3GAD3_9ROSI|nr:hypothetical protein COLO4_36238 [Corchorus olitorius]
MKAKIRATWRIVVRRTCGKWEVWSGSGRGVSFRGQFDQFGCCWVGPSSPGLLLKSLTYATL